MPTATAAAWRYQTREATLPRADDLVRKLKGNPSFIFTLIQKFNNPDIELIIPDHDVVILCD